MDDIARIQSQDEDMHNNRNIQVNWGTFNVPTILGMGVVFAAVWNLSGTLERQSSQLASIESNRLAKAAETAEQIRDLKDDIAAVPTLQYRITVLETGLAAVNARVDRQTDTIGDLREAIGAVNTSIGVLTQKLEVLFPVTPKDR